MKTLEQGRNFATMIWTFLDGLFAEKEQKIDPARIRWEEHFNRRHSERDLSGKDARACTDRVRRRMTEGDRTWIPPYYNMRKRYAEWLRKNRRHVRTVPSIAERREA